MSLFSRRSLICSAFFVGLLPTALIAADKPKEIRIDWATYNPVSMVLKEKGLLEKEFANDGSLTATILKNIKRAMAGEYSRELSVKVFAGQSRIAVVGHAVSVRPAAAAAPIA